MRAGDRDQPTAPGLRRHSKGGKLEPAQCTAHWLHTQGWSVSRAGWAGREHAAHLCGQKKPAEKPSPTHQARHPPAVMGSDRGWGEWGRGEARSSLGNIWWLLGQDRGGVQLDDSPGDKFPWRQPVSRCGSEKKNPSSVFSWPKLTAPRDHLSPSHELLPFAGHGATR